MQGDVDLYGINGNPPFRNLGELRKSSGASGATMGVSGSYPVSFENLGTVTVLSGYLQFFGGGLLTGFYSMLPGTRVDFVCGTWTQPPTSPALFTGGGEARFTGGVIRLLDRIPNLRLLGGAAILLPDFQAAGAITNLVLEGTTLSGTNLVLAPRSVAPRLPMTIAGCRRHDGWRMTGPVRLGAMGCRTFGVGTKTLNGALTNLGTVRIRTARFIFGPKAQVDSAVVDMQVPIRTPWIHGNPSAIRPLRRAGDRRPRRRQRPIRYFQTWHGRDRPGTLSFFGTSTLSNALARNAKLTDYGRINVYNLAPAERSNVSVGGINRSPAKSSLSSRSRPRVVRLPAGFAGRHRLADRLRRQRRLTVLGACTPAPQGWPLGGGVEPPTAVANRDGAPQWRVAQRRRVGQASVSTARTIMWRCRTRPCGRLAR
jgi:hypothetical protein